ncbi:UNVERIFIED_CONTAM: DNA polymerase III delta subunit [Acetivibrio alkalicellulosi]
MSLEILKKDIKNKDIKNLYLFYGDEDFLKKYYLEKIEEIILKNDLTNLNKIVLDGKVQVENIIESCDTVPVFSERKLVVVKKSGIFTAKAKQDGNDQLTEYLASVAPYTCLVFFEDSIDKRIKLVDRVKKNGLIVEFPYQKQPELVKWVVKAFNSSKKEIDVNTASYLVNICEPGMTQILNEVNKVVLYLGEKVQVDTKVIDKVCTKSIKSRIFDLIDAIAEKRINIALKLLNDMIILKEPLPKILIMIARQLRLILEMKLLCDEGMAKKDVCSKMGITPYVGNKVYDQTRSFSVDKLKEVIKETMELDLAIKTGKINDRIAAEVLICKMAED